MIAMVLRRKQNKEELKEILKLESQYALLVEQTNKAWDDVRVSESFFNTAEHSVIDKEEDVSYVDVAILNHEAMKIRYRLLLKETKTMFLSIQSIKQRIAQP